MMVIGGGRARERFLTLYMKMSWVLRHRSWHYPSYSLQAWGTALVDGSPTASAPGVIIVTGLQRIDDFYSQESLKSDSHCGQSCGLRALFRPYASQ
jgi:hypothetical protein